jgi:hypothetical protein
MSTTRQILLNKDLAVAAKHELPYTGVTTDLPAYQLIQNNGAAMSLDNIDQVDAIGIDRASGTATLTITDYWDWLNEKQHLVALQEKINSYFRFIESGEIYDSYPQARGRHLQIDIITMYPLSPLAEALLKSASKIAQQLNVKITTRHVPGQKNHNTP